jgi:nicotinamidase-related amidase
VRALIVVDVLNDFLKPEGALYLGDGADRVIEEVRALVESFREKGELVIFVCDSHRKGDGEFSLYPEHCVKGTWGSRVVEEIGVKEGEYVVEKRRFDGFFQTDLDLLLRELKVEELHFCGVATNICVMATVSSAVLRGYKCVVYRRAVASFDGEAHEFALKHMEKYLGVKVVD